jgi:putative effector of murein hydrolase LrgA (UPF0299 family)
MLGALTTLRVLRPTGEGIVQFGGWPIPGPVIGLLLLFVALSLLACRAAYWICRRAGCNPPLPAMAMLVAALLMPVAARARPA